MQVYYLIFYLYIYIIYKIYYKKESIFFFSFHTQKTQKDLYLSIADSPNRA